MGVVASVGFDTWPRQGPWLGKRTVVCFHYDTSRTVMGTVVRNDAEAPFRTVISLDNGRIVLGDECMHSPK